MEERPKSPSPKDVWDKLRYLTPAAGSVILATTGTLIAFYLGSSSEVQIESIRAQDITEVRVDVSQLKAIINGMESEIRELSTSVSQLNAKINDVQSLNVMTQQFSDLNQIENRLKILLESKEEIITLLPEGLNDKLSEIDGLSNKLAKLEDNDQRVADQIRKIGSAMLEDADRFIALPLFKSEISSDIKTIRSEIDNLEGNIATIQSVTAEAWSTFRWIIGTMALAIVTAVIPSLREAFLGKRKAEGV